MYSSLDGQTREVNEALQAAHDAWQAALAEVAKPRGLKSEAANHAISKAQPLFEAAQVAVDALDPTKSKKPSSIYRAPVGRTRSKVTSQEVAYNNAKQAFEELKGLRSQVIQLNSGFRVVKAATYQAPKPEGHFADIGVLVAQIAELKAANHTLSDELRRARAVVSPPGVIKDKTEEDRLVRELGASQQTIAALTEQLRKYQELNKGEHPMPR